MYTVTAMYRRVRGVGRLTWRVVTIRMALPHPGVNNGTIAVRLGTRGMYRLTRTTLWRYSWSLISRVTVTTYRRVAVSVESAVAPRRLGGLWLRVTAARVTLWLGGCHRTGAAIVLARPVLAVFVLCGGMLVMGMLMVWMVAVCCLKSKRLLWSILPVKLHALGLRNVTVMGKFVCWGKFRIRVRRGVHQKRTHGH